MGTLSRSLALAALCTHLSAQPWSGILPAGRGIDWSAAGVPGGIPNRTTICSSVSAATYSNGASDASAGIQAALDACPSGQVVLLSAGNFLINSSLRVPSNVTLRGLGTQSTILLAQGTSGAVINMGAASYISGPSAASSTAVNVGATAGSSLITVASATGITVGTYLLITELNDADYVTPTTPNGTCTWCDNSMWSATRVRGQIVEVTSVSGTDIGVSPALYSDYPLTPFATRFTAGAKYAGLESLQIYASQTGYVTNISITMCAYCWVKGVESNYANGDHVKISFSYRSEVRDSYFTSGFSHTSGGTDDCIFFGGKASANLIENNILERLHVGVMLNWGAAGNVIAYNYFTGLFDSGSPNVVLPDINLHGAHPQFNLLEGNSFASFWADSFWGSGSHNVALRNWARATQWIAPFSDATYTGRKQINWAGGHWGYQQNRGITLSYPHTSFSLVGNVSGGTAVTGVATTTIFTTGPAECTACRVAPGTRNYERSFYAFSIGYNLGTDTDGSSVPAEWVGLAYSTAFLDGNYATSTDTTQWNSGSRALPASFFRASKPAWFKSVPWPPIGPDVSGGIDAGAHVYAIPAQACYENTARDGDGLKLFDPASCYDPPAGSRSSGPITRAGPISIK